MIQSRICLGKLTLAKCIFLYCKIFLYCEDIFLKLKTVLYITVARDVSGEKRILIMKINAQHNALN